LPVSAAIAAFEGLSFAPPLDAVGPPLVKEIVGRLAFLGRVGLEYLSLDRGPTASRGASCSGSAWRRRSARAGRRLLRAGRADRGLHPRDTGRLLASLAGLRDQGNSVLVVEHDEATIRAADWLIDLGPGAGPDGGRIVAAGPPGSLVEFGASATARHLRGEASPPAPSSDRLARSPGAIAVVGASEHNLRGIDVRIPLGTLTSVSGVSGSGKSTLVLDILARAARRALEGTGPRPGAHARIEGLEAIDKQITIDQAPIGRTPRSTPATYTGVFDEIRRSSPRRGRRRSGATRPAGSASTSPAAGASAARARGCARSR
jgi:excinuclease ABC subunit A